MESELIDIFNEKMEKIGTFPRKEVHAKGYWHKAFHCWIFQIVEGVPFVIFQKRQFSKDTFPDLLDISAAGHLLTGEDEKDGLREVEEELGLFLLLEDLIPGGVVKYQDHRGSYIDNEFCYVNFYQLCEHYTKLKPNADEVAGVYMVPFHKFLQLWKGKIESIQIQGFCYENGGRKSEMVAVTKTDFVPHPQPYFNRVLVWLSQIINKQIAETI